MPTTGPTNHRTDEKADGRKWERGVETKRCVGGGGGRNGRVTPTACRFKAEALENVSVWRERERDRNTQS